MSLHGLAEDIRDAVLKDLLGRSGFDWMWDEIDPGVQEEIRVQMLSIVANRLRSATGEPELSPWTKGMRAMIGKWVTVTVSRDPDLVEHSGVLHVFSDEGDVALEDETGCWTWCWPNLDCRETERPR